MKKILAFSLFAALVLASCSPNEKFAPTPVDQPGMTIRATIADETRTYLVEEGDVYSLYWKSGDMIRCTDDDHTAYYQTTDNGVKGANFTWVDMGDPEKVLSPDSVKFWAYFPADRGRKLAAVQQYCENGITAAPLRGFYQREPEEPFAPVFVFKNLCGALKLNLTTTQSDVKVVSIVLRADNGLSGSYTNAPEVADSSIPAIEKYYKQVVSNATSPVTLNCPEVAIGTDPVPFFISVPPYVYHAFSVTVITSDGRTQTRSMKAEETLTIERSMVHELTLAFDNLQKPAVGATATFMKGPDMNVAIKCAVNPDVANYSDDDSTVTKMVFVTNSDLFSAVNIADETSESPIYVLYDEATTTVTVATPAPKFVMNANSAYFFHRFRTLTDIEGIDDFDASKVETMAYFWGYSPKQSIVMPAWDYSSLINTRYMFDCVYSESVDVSNMNFDSDTSMAYMFYYADLLTEIIWPAEVQADALESTHSMFRYCGMSLIDLKMFKNTSGLQRMQYMFAYAPNLQKVIADFDLSGLSSGAYMFYYCSENAGTLDLTEFGDIATSTKCNSFFRHSLATTIDLSTWNTSNVDNFDYCFYQLPNLFCLKLGPDFGFTPASGKSTPGNNCMFAGTSDATSGVKTASVPGYLNIYTSEDQALWLHDILTLRRLRNGYYDNTPVPVTFFDSTTEQEISLTWKD